MFLGGFFYLLHAVFGRFFWLARVTLFALSCLYILQKFEGDPERAVLPLCFIMAVYFMTGPVGAYWRRGGGAGSLEEKIDHLDTQVRLLNIRLSRVMDSLERSGEQWSRSEEFWWEAWGQTRCVCYYITVSYAHPQKHNYCKCTSLSVKEKVFEILLRVLIKRKVKKSLRNDVN